MPRPFLLFASLLGGMTLLPLTLISQSVEAQSALPNPFVSPLFSDNMVLQREKPIKVWGWATPGEAVTVTFADKSAKATTDVAGKWMATLPAMKADNKPYTLAIVGKSGSASYGNVVLGDVWICSGQSNMEMGIGVAKDAEKEIAAANYPLVRLYTVQKKIAYSPQNLLKGTWDVCTPKTVSTGGWGGFSAVGYYFGRKLNEDLHIPIGLIHTSWGGTIAEAWVSAGSLSSMGDFNAAIQQVEMTAKQGDGDMSTKMKSWWKDNEPANAKNYGSLDFSATNWATMKLPGYWEGQGLPDFDGLVYFRKEINLPDSAAGKAGTLFLGGVDDRDATYINGQFVGSMSNYNDNRVYKIPAGVLKAGKNIIAVSVLDTGGGGGIYGGFDKFSLEVEGQSTDLTGDWQYLKGETFTKLPPVPLAVGTNPNIATVLYNGMVSPLVPFAVKGAIWYQGESNAGRAAQYQKLLPTLITDWRKQFGVGDFPFYIVQLASFMARDTEPRSDAWPLLREAQELTATNVKNSGLAVAIDIGEANDIHPKNKQEVGRRLALNALAKTYGEKIAYSGPTYKTMNVKEGTVVLHFDNLNGGLTLQSGQTLTGFAIAGEDKKFVWADAKIVGDTVVVSSASVTKPVAVRYAWGNNPDCNLANKAELPAVPFRTDRW